MKVNLLPWQKLIYEDQSQYQMLYGGRKIGKSWLIPILMLRDAKQGARQIIYCASAFEQTSEVWARWMEDCFTPFIRKFKVNPRRIWLKDGCVITLVTAGSKFRLRGPKADSLFLDEAAFIPDTIINQVLLPMLIVAKHPRIFITSTPNGETGWFYEQLSNPLYKRWFKTFVDNPYANTKFIEERRKDMTEQDFQQEYLGQFVSSGSAAIKDLTPVLIDQPNPVDTIISSIGIDLGRHNDQTCIVFLDNHLEVRGCIFLPDMDWPTQSKTILKYVQAYPAASVCIDRSGVGDVVSETLMITLPHRNIRPFIFSQSSRTILYKQLIQTIQTGGVKIPKKYEKLIQQLKGLRYKKVGLDFRYDHPPGGHDDGCIALALALEVAVTNSRSLPVTLW